MDAAKMYLRIPKTCVNIYNVNQVMYVLMLDQEKYNPGFFNQIKRENKKWLSNAKQHLWNFAHE